MIIMILVGTSTPCLFPSKTEVDLDMVDVGASITPRLRMSRHSNKQNAVTPNITTTPTATRSGTSNPAAVLRALLSRLPAHPPSPTKSSTEKGRDSDFDTVSESNVAPSIAQDALREVPPKVLPDLPMPSSSDDTDEFENRSEMSFESPPSPRRQKSPKSPKIRVLDAFGREHDPDESHVEDAEAAATPSHSTVSRGELLSRIRNGLNDLVVGIDDLDRDGHPLSIDHDRMQELVTISSRSRGLRESLISHCDRIIQISSTKSRWLPANPMFHIFLVILQLSLMWLVYRISINRAREIWLNRYYDPFNPELHLYIFKSDASIYVLRSEGARKTARSSLVGHIWDGWIYFVGNMGFCFWQALDKGPVLRYDNARTPT